MLQHGGRAEQGQGKVIRLNPVSVRVHSEMFLADFPVRLFNLGKELCDFKRPSIIQTRFERGA